MPDVLHARFSSLGTYPNTSLGSLMYSSFDAQPVITAISLSCLMFIQNLRKIVYGLKIAFEPVS